MENQNTGSVLGLSKPQKEKLPLLGVVFIISLFINIKFEIASILLTPYRLVLLVVFIPAFVKWMSGKFGGRLSTDYFLLGYVIWAFIAITIHHGTERMALSTMYSLEVFGTYLIARWQIRNRTAFITAIKIFWTCLFLLIPFALYEGLTNQNLLLRVLGPFAADRIYMDPRIGLFRAQTVFDHPIHFGILSATFCAFSTIVLGYGKSAVKRLWRMAITIVSTILSVSGGAYTLLAMQLGFMSWGAIVKSPRKWKYLMALIAAAYVTIDILSTRSPYVVLISYLSFSTQSAYNRILIWRYSSDDLFRNPLFGIGFNDWDRPDWMHSGSMDNFWLVTAVRYGIPGFLLLVFAVASSLRRLVKSRIEDPYNQAVRRAYGITLVSVCISVMTVHLWGSSFILFAFLLGTVSWLGIADKPKRRSITDISGSGA